MKKWPNGAGRCRYAWIRGLASSCRGAGAPMRGTAPCEVVSLSLAFGESRALQRFRDIAVRFAPNHEHLVKRPGAFSK
jgi:hypothetical protein